MKFEREFDLLVNQCENWLHKRRRYKDVSLRVVSGKYSEVYANYIYENNVHRITLFKDQLISFYIKHPLANSKSFKTFFISTIAHELVHRNQCIHNFGKDFKSFTKSYKTKDIKELIEKEAVQVEMRLWLRMSH